VFGTQGRVSQMRIDVIDEGSGHEVANLSVDEAAAMVASEYPAIPDAAEWAKDRWTQGKYVVAMHRGYALFPVSDDDA